MEPTTAAMQTKGDYILRMPLGGMRYSSIRGPPTTKGRIRGDRHIAACRLGSYITASKSGLSETELEDILCLDEEVLDEVFRFSMPEG